MTWTWSPYAGCEPSLVSLNQCNKRVGPSWNYLQLAASGNLLNFPEGRRRYHHEPSYRASLKDQSWEPVSTRHSSPPNFWCGRHLPIQLEVERWSQGHGNWSCIMHHKCHLPIFYLQNKKIEVTKLKWLKPVSTFSSHEKLKFNLLAFNGWHVKWP